MKNAAHQTRQRAHRARTRRRADRWASTPAAPATGLHPADIEKLLALLQHQKQLHDERMRTGEHAR